MRGALAGSGAHAKTSLLQWLVRHRVEALLFAVSFFVLASFSGQRFLRQSAAPHFIYQAQAWLDGRLDIDPAVLPNLEDWACVREVGGIKMRCEERPLASDKWYVSFPAFPSVVMLPFVAINGYQLNDTSFTVIAAALALALFYSLLRLLSEWGEIQREPWENALLTVVLGFGTVFFYCSLRGEVWFTAEILGVLFTCLYLRFAVRARRPLWAGVFFSMAVLTRTPLVFAGLFFLLECLCPGPENRGAQLRALPKTFRSALPKLSLFVLGALPLATTAAVYNQIRFGRISEFGHKFLYDNRVNEDIDRLGLFSLKYLPRNLDAAFLKLPQVGWNPFRLSYDPQGLSLFLTLPFLLLLFWPKGTKRLTLPLWLAVLLCALPGLFYQNTGYMQFGFRFSLDYTPYLLLLLAASGWSLKSKPATVLLALGFLFNFWGAVAFHGYTEWVRGW